MNERLRNESVALFEACICAYHPLICIFRISGMYEYIDNALFQ